MAMELQHFLELQEQFLHKQSLEMTGLTKRIVSGREEPSLGSQVSWVVHDFSIYSLVISRSYGKSPFFMGKLTISMAIFNSFLYVYQRVILGSIADGQTHPQSSTHPKCKSESTHQPQLTRQGAKECEEAGTAEIAAAISQRALIPQGLLRARCDLKQQPLECMECIYIRIHIYTHNNLIYIYMECMEWNANSREFHCGRAQISHTEYFPFLKSPPIWSGGIPGLLP